jgi:radical SAM protein with 4Fe4S-binding SPASM domain
MFSIATIKSLVPFIKKNYPVNLNVSRIANMSLNAVESLMQTHTCRSLPLQIDLVPTRACNLACRFCKNYATHGSKHISVSDVERIAPELFPTALWLKICSGGEPYLHKNLEDILRIARRYNLMTFVLSNGMQLQEERLRAIVREGLITRHGFSVDGIRDETVERIRIKSKLSVILHNIRMLLRIIREEGRKHPAIAIRYVLMKSTIDELPDAVRYWGEQGITYLDCSYLSLCNDIDRDESLFFHQEHMIAVFNKARAIAKHYPHLRLTLPLPTAAQMQFQKRPKPCRLPWNFVMIDTDGSVVPCYCVFEAFNFGNLYRGELSFKDIWNCRNYQELRTTVNHDHARKFYSYCSLCECRFGWSSLSAHLGDETWLTLMKEASLTNTPTLQHKRP